MTISFRILAVSADAGVASCAKTLDAENRRQNAIWVQFRYIDQLTGNISRKINSIQTAKSKGWFEIYFGENVSAIKFRKE